MRFRSRGSASRMAVSKPRQTLPLPGYGLQNCRTRRGIFTADKLLWIIQLIQLWNNFRGRLEYSAIFFKTERGDFAARNPQYIYVFYESPYTETHFENLSVHCVVILLTCTRTVSMWRLQKFWHQMHSKPSATISNGLCYAHSLTCSDRWHFSNQLLHSSKAWLFRNHAILWHTFQLTKHFEILHSPRQWYFHVL